MQPIKTYHDYMPWPWQGILTYKSKLTQTKIKSGGCKDTQAQTFSATPTNQQLTYNLQRKPQSQAVFSKPHLHSQLHTPGPTNPSSTVQIIKFNIKATGKKQTRLDLRNALHVHSITKECGRHTKTSPHPSTHSADPSATKFQGDLRRRVVHGQRRVSEDSFSFPGKLILVSPDCPFPNLNSHPSFHEADELEGVHGLVYQKVWTTPNVL